MKIFFRINGKDVAGGSPQRPSGEVPHRPSKEEVRSWLRRVIASHRPPPSIADTQNDLWHLDHDDKAG